MNTYTMNIISKFLLLLMLFTHQVYAGEMAKSLFNSMQYAKAKKELPILSESGDSDASFWLAVIQFRTGESSKAGDTMLKAAEQGNPWAMRLMVPQWNGYCGYLSWPCDDQWREKAISGWEKLATNHDGKAIYALLKWGEQWWKAIPLYKSYKYKELVTKAVKNGGYQAVSYNSSFPIEIKDKINLLKYAVSKSDTNSMYALYLYCNEKKIKMNNCEDLLKNGLKFGDVSFASALYSRYRGFYNDKFNFKMIDIDKAYYYYYIARHFNIIDDSFDLRAMDYTEEQNDLLMNQVNELNKEKIESNANEYIKRITPNLYYDESFPYDVLLKP